MAVKDPATSESGDSQPLIPPTILECFQEPLPDLRKSDRIGYKSVQPSGHSTANALPPKVLIYEDAKDLIEIAEGILNRPDIKQSRLGMDRINTVDKTFYGETEMDVVTASLAGIILPIKEVLNVLYPNMFEIGSEFNRKVALDTLEDGNQVSEQALRCDFVYKKPNSGEDQTIAVLEYKRRGLLRYTDWEKGIISHESSTDQINRAIHNAGNSKDVLQYNAMSYTKQVTAYAVRTHCKHVAIFNWDHALFFLFEDLVSKKDLGLKRVRPIGQRARLIWGTEEKKTPQAAKTDGENEFVNIGILRKMILGWVLRAFQDAFPEHKDL